MNKRLKNRICFSAIAALIVGFMVEETFAYDWTQIEEVTNEFETGKYSTQLKEEFLSPNHWVPGQCTNKEVSVLNNGTVPVYAKIELSQAWTRRENIYDLEGNIIKPEAGERVSISFVAENGEEYAANIIWGEDVAILSNGVCDNLSLGLPEVNCIEEAKGKWLLLDEETEGDFVFYYIGVLNPNSETPLLIDGVEMNPGIQAAILEKNTVWDKVNKKWVTTTISNQTNDYENATYRLSVSMDTVQATSSAVEELFGSDKLSEQNVINYLQFKAITGENITYSRAEVDEKILYLREGDGELLYIPSSQEENWFMSFFNMIPGEEYSDSMIIKNQSNNTYNIYMQAITKESQEQVAEELLEYIKMTVYYNGKTIFEGTAQGKDYKDTLFDVIYLGKYLSGEANLIAVELTLDKQIPIEYANILATTDWRFMVEEEIAPSTPQTGDNNDSAQYIVFMAISLIGLWICICKIRLSFRE